MIPWSLIRLRLTRYRPFILLILTAISTLWIGSMLLDRLHWKPVRDQSKLKRENPTFTKDQTYKYRLSNGLNLLIIRSPGAAVSAAALSVRAGSWDDPPKAEGTAQLVENLVWRCGNRSYAKNDCLADFFQHNGASFRGKVYADLTNYSIRCDSERFRDSFDRFCAMIASPNFDEDSTQHQILKRGQRPLLDQKQLTRLLLSFTSEHPLARKSPQGNVNALQRLKPKHLKRWWKDYYRPNEMNLVVLSPLHPHQVKNIAVKHFKHLQSSSKQIQRIQVPWWSGLDASKRMVLTSPSQNYTMTLAWPIAPLNVPQYWPKQWWISWFMKHSENGGLPHILRHRRWIYSLNAESEVIGTHGYFKITLQLTPEGYKQRLMIIEKIYDVMHDLAQINPIPSYLYDERFRKAELEYRFGSRIKPQQFAFEAAESLADESLSTYPRRSLLPTRSGLKHLQQQVRYILKQPMIEVDTLPVDVIEREGFEISLTHPDEPQLRYGYAPAYVPQLARNPEDSYQLALFPSRTPYLPLEDPPIVPTKPYSVHCMSPTQILKETGPLTVYYTQDTLYGGAKSTYHFRLYTPRLDTSLKSKLLTELWLLWMKHHYAALLDKMERGGYEVSMRLNYKCIKISVTGWTRGIEGVISDLFRVVQQGYDNSSPYQRLKEHWKSNVANLLMESPFKENDTYLRSQLTDDYYTFDETLAMLEEIDESDLAHYSKTLFSFLHLDVHAFTPLSSTQILNQSQAWRNLFPLETQPRPLKLDYSLPALQRHLRFVRQLPGKISALALHVDHASMHDDISVAAVNILSEDLSKAYTEQLQHKQHLACLATALSRSYRGRLITSLSAYSTQHCGVELEQATQTFLKDYSQRIQSYDEATFRDLKNSVIKKWSAPFDNGKSYSGYIVNMIYNRCEDFNKRSRLIHMIENIDLKMWKALVKNIFDTKYTFTAISIVDPEPTSTDPQFNQGAIEPAEGQ